MFERIQSEPGRVLLHLRGGLDGPGSREMGDSLAALVSVEAREVVIDFSAVPFMDGSGVGAIAFLFKRLAARGRRLTLRGVGGQPLAMFRHLGLAGPLGIDGAQGKRSLLSFGRFAWAR